MKMKRLVLFTLLCGSLMMSCADDMDDEVRDPSYMEIADFIYRGMNDIYLYKSDIPELADGYFENKEEYVEYLSDWDSPSNLFYKGLVATSKDRFSFITDDYEELENTLSGISLTSGMDYRLSYLEENGNDLVGYIRYVNKNTPAEEQGLKRGMLFLEVNGTKLTIGNYEELLANENITLNLAEFGKDGSIANTGESIAITQEKLTINPILISKVFDDINGTKVGYLMYNSFVNDFDPALNNVFATFQAEGVQELVLDLRYNGGGSVETAVNLASMITGQFKDKIFMQIKFNDQYQAFYEKRYPEELYYKFDNIVEKNEATINSLNLNRVYVIGTGSTASASELIINGLKPYIDVVQIGTKTVGKFQASQTRYDSPTFGSIDRNPNHKYAIQPLIFKSANADGVTDYVDGLEPDIMIKEYVNSYGTLGEKDEPLLAAALAKISGKTFANTAMKSRITNKLLSADETEFNEPIKNTPTFQKMYVENLPFEE